MSVRIAAAWAIGSQYAAFAIQFIASVVLARYFISPAELGLFSIAFAAVTLFSFLQDFGVNRYVTGERDLTPEKLRTALTTSLAFGFGVALLALALALPISKFYDDPAMLPVALVIACGALLVPWAVVPQALLQRELDFRSNAMIDFGSAIANALVAILLAWNGWGALALAWGYVAQQAGRALISQWRAGGIKPWPLSISGCGPVLEIGGVNSVASICGSLVARAPELVIGHRIGNEAAGLFTRASGLAFQLRLLVTGAVTAVFYPAFRRVRDEGAPLGPPYLRVVAAYTGISWPAMAGIAVLGDPIILFLYGEQWTEAGPLLVWIALSQIAFLALPLSTDLPLLMGKMRGLICRHVLDAMVSILLLIAAAPYGLAWMAASRLAHGLFWLLLYAGFMQRTLQFGWRGLLDCWLRSALATVAAILPTLIIYRFWQGPAEIDFLTMVLASVLGAGCWFLTLFVLRHPAREDIIGIAAHVLNPLLVRLNFRPV